jgi:hypothetical protein
MQDAVQFTKKEQETVDRRDQNVESLGLNPLAAATLALDEHEGRVTKKFVEYLSGGTLTLTKGTVVVVEHSTAA